MRSDPEYITARTILSRLGKKDTTFGLTYNMNLYRGCQHGCIYCDTRSTCYGIGDISNIRVKENAVMLLELELSRKKVKGTIGTGSMNDPYMPLEASEQITRQALEVIASKKFPIHIITKGSLVSRDTDLIREISRVYAAVSFTVTTADDHTARKIEPRASLPSARFRAMEELASQGIYTGVTMMPLLPWITDGKGNIKEIVTRASDSGASYIIPMFGLTLRDGSRDYYYNELDRQFPGMKEKYQREYGNNYICNSPSWYRLKEEFEESLALTTMTSGMKLYNPPPNPQLSIF